MHACMSMAACLTYSARSADTFPDFTTLLGHLFSAHERELSDLKAEIRELKTASASVEAGEGNRDMDTGSRTVLSLAALIPEQRKKDEPEEEAQKNPDEPKKEEPQKP